MVILPYFRPISCILSILAVLACVSLPCDIVNIMPSRLKAGAAQRKAVSKPATHIDQAQSLQLCKTFVHSSISSLGYLRDLFPRECYDEFYYNIDKGVVDYNEFVKGNNGKLVKNHQRNGPQLRVMKRGRVAKVDAFLDALENGVFSVLEHGWLLALELIITSEVTLPLRVLEKYTYYFHYGGSKVQAITVPGFGNVPISLETICRDMRSVIKHIIEIDRVLPRLPAKRYLVIQVHYTEDAPEDFDPPGFSETCNTILRVEQDRGWKCDDIEFGNFHTKDHRIVLVGSILENDRNTAILPTDLNFVEVSNKCANPFEPKPTLSSEGEETVDGPSSLILDSKIAARPQTSIHEVESARQKLQSMQLLPNANGDVETQPVTQNSPDTQEFTEMFDSRLPLKLCLIYLNGLENHRKLLLDVKSPTKCEQISCQCGWNEDDGDMIQCQYCGSWQHVICYGYTSRDDTCIPTDYACNACLLKISGLIPKEDLCELSNLRNAVHILLTTGYLGDKEFQSMLRCDTFTTDNIIEQLVNTGLLTFMRTTRSRSYKNQCRFFVIRDNVVKTRVVNDYFDPTLYIEFLFEDREANTRVEVDLPSGHHLETDTFTSPISDSDHDCQPRKELIGQKREKRERIPDGTELEGRKKRRQRVSASVNVFNVAVKSP